MYVDYCLVQDLVSDYYRSVRFYTDFDDFLRTPLPMASVDEYFLHGPEHGVRPSTARRIAGVAANRVEE